MPYSPLPRSPPQKYKTLAIFPLFPLLSSTLKSLITFSCKKALKNHELLC